MFSHGHYQATSHLFLPKAPAPQGIPAYRPLSQWGLEGTKPRTFPGCLGLAVTQMGLRVQASPQPPTAPPRLGWTHWHHPGRGDSITHAAVGGGFLGVTYNPCAA